MGETRVYLRRAGMWLMALLMAVFAGMTPSLAETSEPVYENDPCLGEEGYRDSWLDHTHAYLSRKLCEPAVWFDDFFGDERSEQEGRPSSFVRWRNSATWTEGDGLEYRTRFSANVRLPKIERRLRLIISGETRDDPTEVLPDDPVDPGFELDPEVSRLNVGLRYDLLERPRYKLSLGSGVRLRFPVDPYARIRFRYTHPMGDVSLLRLIQTGLWRKDDGFSETTQLDLERALSESTLLRWGNSGTYGEITDGLNWASQVSLLHQFSDKTAISLDVGASGVTEPGFEVSNYRAGMRFRQNFYRKWLFYELEPSASWPKDVLKNGRNASYAMTFALEFQFNTMRGKAAKEG
ncbi:MAG: hypothetical protein R8K46_08520 [Mariprofundaceae bacterium]